jgi:UDP:flavonoid glycosyltransferase YjiC (YdhE family)
MPCVLLAWELGAGSGHVQRLSRIARQFAPHSFRLVAAVKNLRAAAPLAADGIELLQAPVWPSVFLADAQRAAKSSATFGDMLAELGLADEEALHTMLAAWDGILGHVQPALIVADYAPVAMLAARGRIPRAIVGSGFTVPPAEMASFPLLHRLSPPVWREPDVTAIVNTALRARSTPPIDRLPQIFECDARSVQTFPLLDPYQAERSVPADGPLIVAPAPRREASRAIFFYSAGGYRLRDDVIAALRPLGARLRVYGPGLASEQSAALAAAGALLEPAPPPLSEALSSAHLFIHLGGVTAAAEALVAGVPQLVLSTHIEQELNGLALERAGVGRLLKLHDPAAHISTETIEAMTQDTVLAARAGALGESHRRMLQDFDTLPKFDRACMGFLS